MHLSKYLPNVIKITLADLKRDKTKHRTNRLEWGADAHTLTFPRYFWYVFPESLDTKEYQIPSYAGILRIRNGEFGYWNVNIERNAPAFTKAKKITDKKIMQIGRSLMYKYWTMRDIS